MPRKKAEKTPASDEKAIKCKKCQAKVVVTPGLDEMVQHWELFHADLVDKMRAGHRPDPQFHD